LDTPAQPHPTPEPLNPNGFNAASMLPYGLTVQHVAAAMSDFLEFLDFINFQLYRRAMPPLEQFLMPASFSSLVGSSW
jgi:hypothetical protein